MDDIYCENMFMSVCILLKYDAIIDIEVRSHILPFPFLDILSKYGNAVNQILSYTLKIILVLLLVFCHGHMFFTTDFAQLGGFSGCHRTLLPPHSQQFHI